MSIFLMTERTEESENTTITLSFTSSEKKPEYVNVKMKYIGLVDSETMFKFIKQQKKVNFLCLQRCENDGRTTVRS